MSESDHLNLAFGCQRSSELIGRNQSSSLSPTLHVGDAATEGTGDVGLKQFGHETWPKQFGSKDRW